MTKDHHLEGNQLFTPNEVERAAASHDNKLTNTTCDVPRLFSQSAGET